MSYATALHTYEYGRCVDCGEPIPEVPARVQAAHGGLVHDVDQSRSSRSWLIARCNERVPGPWAVSDQPVTCVACAALATRRPRRPSDRTLRYVWLAGLALQVVGALASNVRVWSVGLLVWACASTAVAARWPATRWPARLLLAAVNTGASVIALRALTGGRL